MAGQPVIPNGVEISVGANGMNALAQRVTGAELHAAAPSRSHFADIAEYHALEKDYKAGNMGPLTKQWFESDTFYLQKAVKLQQLPQFRAKFGDGIDGSMALTKFAKEIHADEILRSQVRDAIITEEEKKGSTGSFFAK
jgi:hypothetical protein